jgi:hypothetical protein
LNFEFGLSHRTLADKLVGANFSELEDFTCDVARAYVLSLPGGDPRAIATRKLQQWTARPATNERRSHT